jgi:hypothetical protein
MVSNITAGTVSENEPLHSAVDKQVAKPVEHGVMIFFVCME